MISSSASSKSQRTAWLAYLGSLAGWLALGGWLASSQSFTLLHRWWLELGLLYSLAPLVARARAALFRRRGRRRRNAPAGCAGWLASSGRLAAGWAGLQAGVAGLAGWDGWLLCWLADSPGWLAAGWL